jgi:hypothetical protein
MTERARLSAKLLAMKPYTRGRQALERLVRNETERELQADWVDRDFEHEMHVIFGTELKVQ